MKPFLNADFLLPDDCSQRLYHDYAAQMPIIDYHCHLPPADIANDSRFRNMAHAWLGGDHYKWRAMRSNGVPETDITGREPDFRTFMAWAKTVPNLIGNPLYHWTHLELQRYFGICEPLSEKTAPKIWEACNAQLDTPAFGARALLKRMNVRAVGTTDDPADTLEFHVAYAAKRQADDPVMVPSYRPDKVDRQLCRSGGRARQTSRRLPCAGLPRLRSRADCAGGDVCHGRDAPGDFRQAAKERDTSAGGGRCLPHGAAARSRPHECASWLGHAVAHGLYP